MSGDASRTPPISRADFQASVATALKAANYDYGLFAETPDEIPETEEATLTSPFELSAESAAPASITQHDSVQHRFSQLAMGAANTADLYRICCHFMKEEIEHLSYESDDYATARKNQAFLYDFMDTFTADLANRGLLRKSTQQQFDGIKTVYECGFASYEYLCRAVATATGGRYPTLVGYASEQMQQNPRSPEDPNASSYNFHAINMLTDIFKKYGAEINTYPRSPWDMFFFLKAETLAKKRTETEHLHRDPRILDALQQEEREQYAGLTESYSRILGDEPHIGRIANACSKVDREIAEAFDAPRHLSHIVSVCACHARAAAYEAIEHDGSTQSQGGLDKHRAEIEEAKDTFASWTHSNERAFSCVNSCEEVVMEMEETADAVIQYICCCEDQTMLLESFRTYVAAFRRELATHFLENGLHDTQQPYIKSLWSLEHKLEWAEKTHHAISHWVQEDSGGEYSQLVDWASDKFAIPDIAENSESLEQHSLALLRQLALRRGICDPYAGNPMLPGVYEGCRKIAQQELSLSVAPSTHRSRLRPQIAPLDEAEVTDRTHQLMELAFQSVGSGGIKSNDPGHLNAYQIRQLMGFIEARSVAVRHGGMN